MFKQTFCAAMLTFAMVAVAHAQTPAQTPDLPLNDAAASQATPALSPATTPDIVIDDGVPADVIHTHHAMAASDCGCQSSPSSCGATCACGAGNPFRSWKEKCLYYKNVRQSYDRGPCCGNDFGPLWSSYCADRQGCGVACQSCGPAVGCRRCGPRPMLSLHRRHRSSACDTCDSGPAACDGADSATIMPTEAGLDIGQPPEPAEADDDPAPAPPEVDAPAADAKTTSTKTTSSRRKWFARKVGWKRNG